jgi:hypothetical protein
VIKTRKRKILSKLFRKRISRLSFMWFKSKMSSCMESRKARELRKRKTYSIKR